MQARRTAWAAVLLGLCGCLARVDVGPEGHRCDQDTDCGAARCVENRCHADTLLPLLRLGGPVGSEGLFVDSQQAQDLLDQGYVSTGAVVKVSIASDAPGGRIAIYRLHNPTSDDWLYTAAAEEAATASSRVYDSQAIPFYAFGPGSTEGLAVVRIVRGSYHHYVVGDAEQAAAVADGWKVEKTVFRGEAP